MTNEYGPDKPCRRSACATEPAHLGGEHIDPRSERYDGPSITVNALGAGPREAARALLAAGAPVPEVVDLVQEIHRWKESWAQEKVNGEKAVRAASGQALDCTEHGKVIDDLEKQVFHFSTSLTKTDKARSTLAVGLLDIEEQLAVLQGEAKRGEELPSAKDLLDAFAKSVAKLRERGRLK